MQTEDVGSNTGNYGIDSRGFPMRRTRSAWRGSRYAVAEVDFSKALVGCWLGSCQWIRPQKNIAMATISSIQIKTALKTQQLICSASNG